MSLPDLLNTLIIHSPDIIGLIGATIALIAYFLLQTKKMSSESILFSFLNAFSSLLILVSLVYSWNLAAFVMESAWMCTSLYGVFAVKKRGVKKENIRDESTSLPHDGLSALLR